MQKKLPPPGLLKKEEPFFTRYAARLAFLLSSRISVYLLQAGISVLIIAVHVLLLSTTKLDRFENVFLDYFFRLRPAIQKDPGIVLVEISEDSLQGIGRWPWPRQYHAVMTHLLSQWKARAVVFDIIFSEPSTSFDDGALQEAFEKSKEVYLPVVLEEQNKEKVWIHSLEDFKSRTRGTGHINIFPDRDGTIRRIRPYLNYGVAMYPHLALRVAYDYLRRPLPGPDALPFPLDPEGNLLINWAGNWSKAFRHLSFLDLIRSFEAVQNGRKPLIDLRELQGKICLIGLTATGHADIKATPLEPSYPVLGVLANVINGILTNQFLREATRFKNGLYLVGIGLLACLCFIPFRNVYSLIAGGILGLAWAGIAFFIFARHGMWLYVLQPLLVIVTLFIFSAIYAHLVARREQSRLFQLATRDGLTGAYVIRHFRLMLDQAIRESQKAGKTLAVILIDIDHFKQINDTHGHQAGDLVVRETVRKIHSCIRYARPEKEEDVVGRYGGDELIVMLRNVNLVDASFKVANRILETIRETRYRFEDKEIRVTLSVGVAVLHSGEQDAEILISRADEALYRAKKGGRNQICLEGIDTSIKS